MKVDFHSETRVRSNGLVIVIVATGRPDSATAINLENGMTEAAMHERIANAFRTLAAGIAEDNRSAA